MQKLYKVLNKKYFGGLLPKDIIVYSEDMPGLDGYYEDETIYIGLHLKDDELKSTLIHEMIHVWQELFAPMELFDDGSLKLKAYDKKIHSGFFLEVCNYLEDITGLEIM